MILLSYFCVLPRYMNMNLLWVSENFSFVLYSMSKLTSYGHAYNFVSLSVVDVWSGIGLPGDVIFSQWFPSLSKSKCMINV